MKDPPKIIKQFTEYINRMKTAGVFEEFKELLFNGEMDMIELVITRGEFEPITKGWGVKYCYVFNRFVAYIKYSKLILEGKRAQRIKRHRKKGVIEELNPATKVIDAKYKAKEEDTPKEEAAPKKESAPKKEGPITEEFMEKIIDVLAEKVIIKLIQKYNENKTRQ